VLRFLSVDFVNSEPDFNCSGVSLLAIEDLWEITLFCTDRLDPRGVSNGFGGVPNGLGGVPNGFGGVPNGFGGVANGFVPSFNSSSC
jgi:hypothetical protein